MSLSPISTQEIVARTSSASGLTEVAGNHIYYEVGGNGLPIVFLHDGILYSPSFDAQFEAFSHDYTVICYDCLGYGNSKTPDYNDTTFKGTKLDKNGTS